MSHENKKADDGDIEAGAARTDEVLSSNSDYSSPNSINVLLQGFNSDPLLNEIRNMLSQIVGNPMTYLDRVIFEGFDEQALLEHCSDGHGGISPEKLLERLKSTFDRIFDTIVDPRYEIFFQKHSRADVFAVYQRIFTWMAAGHSVAKKFAEFADGYGTIPSKPEQTAVMPRTTQPYMERAARPRQITRSYMDAVVAPSAEAGSGESAASAANPSRQSKVPIRIDTLSPRYGLKQTIPGIDMQDILKDLGEVPAAYDNTMLSPGVSAAYDDTMLALGVSAAHDDTMLAPTERMETPAPGHVSSVNPPPAAEGEQLRLVEQQLEQLHRDAKNEFKEVLVEDFLDRASKNPEKVSKQGFVKIFDASVKNARLILQRANNKSHPAYSAYYLDENLGKSRRGDLLPFARNVAEERAYEVKEEKFSKMIRRFDVPQIIRSIAKELQTEKIEGAFKSLREVLGVQPGVTPMIDEEILSADKTRLDEIVSHMTSLLVHNLGKDLPKIRERHLWLLYFYQDERPELYNEIYLPIYDRLYSYCMKKRLQKEEERLKEENKRKELDDIVMSFLNSGLPLPIASESDKDEIPPTLPALPNVRTQQEVLDAFQEILDEEATRPDLFPESVEPVAAAENAGDVVPPELLQEPLNPSFEPKRLFDFRNPPTSDDASPTESIPEAAVVSAVHAANNMVDDEEVTLRSASKPVSDHPEKVIIAEDVTGVTQQDGGPLPPELPSFFDDLLSLDEDSIYKIYIEGRLDIDEWTVTQNDDGTHSYKRDGWTMTPKKKGVIVFDTPNGDRFFHHPPAAGRAPSLRPPTDEMEEITDVSPRAAEELPVIPDSPAAVPAMVQPGIVPMPVVMVQAVGSADVPGDVPEQPVFAKTAKEIRWSIQGDTVNIASPAERVAGSAPEKSPQSASALLAAIAESAPKTASPTVTAVMAAVAESVPKPATQTVTAVMAAVAGSAPETVDAPVGDAPDAPHNSRDDETIIIHAHKKKDRWERLPSWARKAVIGVMAGATLIGGVYAGKKYLDTRQDDTVANIASPTPKTSDLQPTSPQPQPSMEVLGASSAAPVSIPTFAPTSEPSAVSVASLPNAPTVPAAPTVASVPTSSTIAITPPASAPHEKISAGWGQPRKVSAPTFTPPLSADELAKIPSESLRKMITSGKIQLKANGMGIVSQISSEFYKNASPEQKQQLKDIQRKLDVGAYATYVERFPTSRDVQSALLDKGHPYHNLAKVITQNGFMGESGQWDRGILSRPTGSNWTVTEAREYFKKNEQKMHELRHDYRSKNNIYMVWGNDQHSVVDETGEFLPFAVDMAEVVNIHLNAATAPGAAPQTPGVVPNNVAPQHGPSNGTTPGLQNGVDGGSHGFLLFDAPHDSVTPGNFQPTDGPGTKYALNGDHSVDVDLSALHDRSANVDISHIDDAWDVIAEQHEIDAGWDTDESIDVDLADLEAPRALTLEERIAAVKGDRRSALLERGEVWVPALSDDMSGSVMQAIENGFMKECETEGQMNRIKALCSEMRLGQMEEFEAPEDGSTFAKMNSKHLAKFNSILNGTAPTKMAYSGPDTSEIDNGWDLSAQATSNGLDTSDDDVVFDLVTKKIVSEGADIADDDVVFDLVTKKTVSDGADIADDDVVFDLVTKKTVSNGPDTSDIDNAWDSEPELQTEEVILLQNVLKKVDSTLEKVKLAA